MGARDPALAGTESAQCARRCRCASQPFVVGEGRACESPAAAGFALRSGTDGILRGVGCRANQVIEALETANDPDHYGF
jgi:hypothetical protein